MMHFTADYYTDLTLRGPETWQTWWNTCFQSVSLLVSPTSSRTLGRTFTCFVSVSVLLLLGANSLHPESRGQEKDAQETE